MEDKIRTAYDAMSPTPEQEERMLAALQEAQQDTNQSRFETAKTVAPISAGQLLQDQAASSPSRKRGGFKAWKVALPLAACLAVVAVLVGVGSLSPAQPSASIDTSAASQTTSNPKEQSAASTSARDEIQDTDMPVAADNAATETSENTGYNAATSSDVIIETAEPSNTEEYAQTDENGFMSTSVNPLSTVSADVDTASYCNIRRMLNQGYYLNDIPQGAVRTEEMLNYFTYDYAEPTGDDKFAIQAQASTCPWNDDTELLVLGFSTAREKDVANKGANLVFLIDVSGSMASTDKLALLQQSFKTLLKHLDERDRVSIVTYSGSEQVVLDGTAGNDTERIQNAINGLSAGGSTNGEAGLRMAYDVAERNFIDGGVNRIVMASDGDLNVGMTSESELYDFVEGKRETGVYLSVLGFGSGNYKDTKMEVLADHGNGSYHYIDCVAEAERVLSERLMANLVPFADDVKVQVEFNPAQVKAYRLIGYENRALASEDFLDDTVDAGDVGPNSQFTVAYEVVLADSAYEVKQVPELKYGTSSASAQNSSDWLTCSLRYRLFSDNDTHEQSITVDKTNASNDPSPDWHFVAAVIEFAMMANHSDYQGNITLFNVVDQAKAGGADKREERAGFLELVEKAQGTYRELDDSTDPAPNTGFDRDSF